MDTTIQRLCSARDFAQISAACPFAVQTRDTVVIPRIFRISRFTSIDAEVLPDRTVVLRPRIDGPGSWSEETATALLVIEEALGCSLGPEPVDCAGGRASLERGWGDFAVRIRPER